MRTISDSGVDSCAFTCGGGRHALVPWQPQGPRELPALFLNRILVNNDTTRTSH